MESVRSRSPADATGTAAITDEHRHQMIATAAYYRAERRGFLDGDSVADWLEAEAQIDRMLEQSLISTTPAQGAAKRTFTEGLALELRRFDAKVEELADRTRRAKRTVRVKYEKQIEALAEKRAAADRQLRDLGDRSGPAWDDLKGDAENLWQDLRQTIEQMASRFK